ncbi:unnamed protein product [Echinostoma caproni]|uniref:CxC2 domain-containing protein n=1 Tax=Echinostoma caproni TaxID=27848 RepID=A0A183BG85_9TREM|nr:unnamed protein product [Echinostoma caproni]
MSKPTDVRAFLTPLIEDLRLLMEDGVWDVEYGRKHGVQLDSVIADAPAKALLKQIKSHTGHFCCPFCTQKGSSCSRRMVFKARGGKLRTDYDFRLRLQDEHHTGLSPFEQLPIDMVGTFPTDYMHSVCLGIMKRLLSLWRKPGGDKRSPISVSHWKILGENLQLACQSLTCEFPRKCRGLGDIEFWKATEYQQFLLYLGPVVLRKVLPPDNYKNFLDFSEYTYILCSTTFADHYLDYIQKQAPAVVVHFMQLYGEAEGVYNVHVWTHLCDDVRRHGVLDNFSAYPYESFMQTIR